MWFEKQVKGGVRARDTPSSSNESRIVADNRGLCVEADCASTSEILLRGEHGCSRNSAIVAITRKSRDISSLGCLEAIVHIYCRYFTPPDLMSTASICSASITICFCIIVVGTGMRTLYERSRSDFQEG
jgi:hypothetical protein